MSGLPWFLRGIDRLVARHERWVTELRDDPGYHEKLLRYATTRDEEARAWLAEAFSRYEYHRASRVWGYYVLTWLVAAFFVGTTSLAGCGLMLLLVLPVPLLVRFDRWNRRRHAYNRLAEGKAMIYEKVEIKGPPEGSRIFQSYWKSGDHGPVELDHPIELMPAVQQANEWWQWLMPEPHETNGRVQWLTVHHDLGLVHRDEQGRRRLLAGGVVYFSYDPWTRRIDTGTYV